MRRYVTLRPAFSRLTIYNILKEFEDYVLIINLYYVYRYLREAASASLRAGGRGAAPGLTLQPGNMSTVSGDTATTTATPFLQIDK